MNQADTEKLNFDLIEPEDKPDQILLNLISSIKNMRRIQLPDVQNKAIMDTITNIKRASYRADLETKFCIALNCPSYPTNEVSPYFMVLQEYIEIFFDKGFDVIEDIMPYLKLLSTDDMFALKEKVSLKLETLKQTLTSQLSYD